MKPAAAAVSSPGFQNRSFSSSPDHSFRFQQPSFRYSKRVKQVGGYVFSIPERLVRSVTGLAAGAAREIGEVILPARVRRSRVYYSIVDSTLRFLIEQIGQVEGAPKRYGATSQ